MIGALLVGPPGGAAVAHADATDASFLASLNSQGITDHVSSSHAIEAGHTVCQKIDGGVSVGAVVTEVLNSSSMPAYDSAYFVGASIRSYCPQYESKIPASS